MISVHSIPERAPLPAPSPFTQTPARRSTPASTFPLTTHTRLTAAHAAALIELASPVIGMEGKFALVNGLNGSVGEITEGRDILLAGFGSMRPDGGGGRSRALMEVSVKAVNKDKCIAANPYSHSRNYINFDHVVCTGGEAGKDSCNGDSGK
jgi:hypothetical protein